MSSERDCAQDYLDFLAEGKACDWCKHPDMPVYRAGLCRHCYDIKQRLRRLQRVVDGARASDGGRRKGGPITAQLEVDYKTTVEMAELAQCEGRKYGSLYHADVTPLQLEHEFSLLSRALLRKDLYYGDADLFACFTPSQKRQLLYIVSRITRGDSRRKRRRLACAETLSKTIDQVLADRSPDSFRVEEGYPPLKRARVEGAGADPFGARGT